MSKVIDLNEYLENKEESRLIESIYSIDFSNPDVTKEIFVYAFKSIIKYQKGIDGITETLGYINTIIENINKWKIDVEKAIVEMHKNIKGLYDNIND